MKILVVDDHDLIREGLRVVLSRLEDGVEIVEAGSVLTGLRAIREGSDFDLAIFDMRLPDGDGTQLMDELGRCHPEVPIIVVSAEDDSMAAAFSHGAMGFVSKSSLNGTLLDGVRAVLAGSIYMPPASQSVQLERTVAAPDVPADSTASRELTERQRAVLSLMMRGLSNRGICEELDLAESTVKIHVSAILRALQVKSRTQAVLTASRLKLVA